MLLYEQMHTAMRELPISEEHLVRGWDLSVPCASSGLRGICGTIHLPLTHDQGTIALSREWQRVDKSTLSNDPAFHDAVANRRQHNNETLLHLKRRTQHFPSWRGLPVLQIISGKDPTGRAFVLEAEIRN